MDASLNRFNYDPVHAIQEAGKALQRAFRLAARRDEGFTGVIRDLTEQVDQALTFDREASLAATHLDLGLPYPVHHSLQTAVWGGMLLLLQDREDSVRRAVLSAGMTANLSILKLQAELEEQDGPPTDEQRERLRQHPISSARLLRLFEIRDSVWLSAVEQHHERLDGTGYPQGLEGDAVDPNALALAFGDAFSAMITPRGYRKSLAPSQALLELRQFSGTHYPDSFMALVLSRLGLYVPGTLLRLEDTSIAVSLGWGSGPKLPRISILVTSGGRRVFHPEILQTGERGVPDVDRALPLDAIELPMNLSLIYGYNATLWR